MKFFTFILLFHLIPSWAVETVLPALRDGSAGSDSHQGEAKFLSMKSSSPSSKAWMVFSQDMLDKGAVVTAKVQLYMDEVVQPGELKVFALANIPSKLENNTSLRDLMKSTELLSQSINSSDNETLIPVDVTASLKAGNFFGLILECGGCEARLKSREGAFSSYLHVTYASSTGPTGPAGGILKGTYPNPALADTAVQSGHIRSGAVTSDKIMNDAVTGSKIKAGEVTSDKILSLAWAKLTGLPSSFIPSAHNHGGDSLLPDKIRIGLPALKAPMIQTMTWNVSTGAGTTSLVELVLDPNNLECPNPDGILHISGTLTNGNNRIPMGVTGDGSQYWDVVYQVRPGNDLLFINHPGAGAQNQTAKILCIYQAN